MEKRIFLISLAALFVFHQISNALGQVPEVPEYVLLGVFLVRKFANLHL